MAVKIGHKITSFAVVSEEDKAKQKAATASVVKEVEFVSERMERPDRLSGETFKVKPNYFDREYKAYYVTINYITLNKGEPTEMVRPFEVFIRGGETEHSEWVTTATRLLTSMFRKGGEYEFMLDELKEVTDTKGGYNLGKGRRANSVIAHIAFVIEDYLKEIGAIKTEQVSESQLQYLESKKEEYVKGTGESVDKESGFPENSQVCASCHTKAAILMDGCLTCLSCGHSKCS